MVNLMTYKYYKQQTGDYNFERLQPVDYLFNTFVLPTLEEMDPKRVIEIIKILEDAESITPDGKLFQSKITDQYISVTNLSSGCKTALLILALKYQQETEGKQQTFVDLSDAGRNALGICFDEMNANQNIIGILYPDICYYGDRRRKCFMLNGKSNLTWLDILDLLNKEDSI